MPGIVPGTEWAAYYAELAAAFGLTIDSRGPNFGLEPLLETIAGSATAGHVRRRADPPHLARRLRPAPHPDPRPGTGLPALADLAPDNPHPALITLRAHLRTIKPILPNASTWTPAWA